MGPDEDKNYTDPVIMHLNPETGEWEEVGKLKDIKEIKGDIPICKELKDMGINSFEDLKTTFKGTLKIDDRDVEYMVLPVQLHFDIMESSFRYVPVRNNMVFYANDYDSVINGMIKRFGAVIKIIDPDRRRILLANGSIDLASIITRLYERNCDNGHVWSIPKIVEAFEPINTTCKNYEVYFIIKVR